jgi:hypothetical protein
MDAADARWTMRSETRRGMPRASKAHLQNPDKLGCLLGSRTPVTLDNVADVVSRPPHLLAVHPQERGVDLAHLEGVVS